ncbi:uncharacterized protein SPPG_08057 [Spizellomyces punctatus DAOM BR117]|uniref:Major facilitator superfamily (MFS) profile domain-containing protein n=1 Tax=Spizellomyces punctatus (strain DAOM BR117) TaxID=645134 RepID=A0A0L0H4M7_SPIPD|nr:uncharacterized protein SPPG_08057 [Spizellomyces punctatus DAOM BR117]KNC96465.1 hypothetical protein SPPG_08057 [Spizellomyces punctatus DAOM BR117]|eukprot:XP_016604505.1 hypothetical protein SPPG_08057 [Spizellomyces punctatus DAOM BR117]
MQVQDGKSSEEEGETQSFLPENLSPNTFPLTPPVSPRTSTTSLLPRRHARSPTSTTLLLLLALVPEGILEAMLIPLYPYLVRATGVDEGSVGYYAGLLSSAFYGPLFVTNVVWGGISDRYGRRRVLLLGASFGFLAAVLLSIGQRLELLFVARLLAGTFGANSTVTKGTLGLLWGDDDGRAWAYSMYGGVYGVSGILGPVLAGLLVGDGEFQRACWVGAVLMGGAVGVLWWGVKDGEGGYSVLDNQDSSKSLPDEDDGDEVKDSVDDTLDTVDPPSPILPITLYCITAFTTSLYMTALPLYLSSPFPGPNQSPQQTSYQVMLIAVTKLLGQTLCFRFVSRWVGKWGCVLLGMAGFLVGLLVIGLRVLGFVEGGLELVLVLLGLSEVCAYLAVIVLITDAASKQSLGLVHGVASTCAAATRTVAPAVAGSLWQWGVGVGGAGRGVVFWAGAFVGALGLLAAAWGLSRRSRVVERIE